MNKQGRIWIFGGTTEGRQLIERIVQQRDRQEQGSGRGNRAEDPNGKEKDADRRSISFFVSVATEYGKDLLPETGEGITVFSGRFSRDEMVEKMQEHGITKAVDATHPYAAEVSRNIREACQICGATYLRLLREESNLPEDCRVVPDAARAAAFLQKTQGNVLLTIGSKELEAFTAVADFRKRLYPRILPSGPMVERAISLGFDPAHLICMQGPFSYEMNRAMLQHTAAVWMVTKESGQAGGFDEKISAAVREGVKILLIRRPEKEMGYSFREVCRYCGLETGTDPDPEQACRESGDGNREKAAEESRIGIDAKERSDTDPEQGDGWFPIFVQMKGKQVLVAGAGRIAFRRIQTLYDFGCRLVVIAPDTGKGEGSAAEGPQERAQWLEQMEREGRLVFRKRAVRSEDIAGKDFVLAATDSRAVNLDLGEACRQAGVPFNTADSREHCDFYFPGIVSRGALTIGLTTGGTDHRLAAEARRKIADALTELQE